MKIQSLQISNILVFKHIDDISQAQKIIFNEKLNILIGQNGAGKSTILEVINFIFRRVIFLPYVKNADLYASRGLIDLNQKREILKKHPNEQSYGEFRLGKNYDFTAQTQKIRMVVELDAIDRANIQHLKDNKEKLSSLVGVYSVEQMFADDAPTGTYQIDIELNEAAGTFTVSSIDDSGFTYLKAYNLYKELIQIYNLENSNDPISNLTESYALIGGYRNYNTYTPHASLGGGNTAEKQIAKIRTNEYVKSTNASEGNEPSIFSLVRLRMAEECFNLITTKSQQACERAANKLDFIKLINEKIKIVNLRVEIKLIDLSNWNFAFTFIDTKRNQPVTDINSLSAGQKAIIHLVFEAYGRGGLKGGLVIIDEPEIHLHYQFQNEYLRVIEKLNKEQDCQYILVTHSEALINSETIESVIRLSLDKQGYSVINKPAITSSQKWLIKILDNQRSTHAFFGSTVLLVEGETDRYFYRAFIGEIEEKLNNGVIQDVSVINIDGRDNEREWVALFSAFGLRTFYISDLDYAWNFYPRTTKYKVNNATLISQFLTDHPDVIPKIEARYKSGVFVLKEGDLETYLGIPKDLTNVINFCDTNLKTYLANQSDSKVQELKTIMSHVVNKKINNLW